MISIISVIYIPQVFPVDLYCSSEAKACHISIDNKVSNTQFQFLTVSLEDGTISKGQS